MSGRAGMHADFEFKGNHACFLNAIETGFQLVLSVNSGRLAWCTRYGRS